MARARIGISDFGPLSTFYGKFVVSGGLYPEEYTYLVDNPIHLVDLARYFMGEVVDVKAQRSEWPGEAWEPNFTVPADRNNSLVLMGYAAELAHFAEVAKGGAAPLATLTDARRALELIDAIYVAGGGVLDPGKTAGAW